MTSLQTETNKILESLSEEERKKVLDILQEYEVSGKSRQLEEIKYSDYKEIPVDIITFIKDRHYLGDAWHTSKGECKLYPYWEKRLKELFPDNVSIDYNSAIFTGSRGLGKSEMAVTITLYMMYRVMCLKNPHDYFGLKPTEKICFAFVNITLDDAKEIGIAKFQATVKLSPWFMEHGSLSPKLSMWTPPDDISIIIGSQPSDLVGKPIYTLFADEINFVQRKDIEEQKKIAMDIIDTAIGGMKTRFIKNGHNFSLLMLASSKNTEKSFMETHMKAQAQIEGVRNFIVDEAVWNVKPPETYCGKRFNVALGNKYLPHAVIDDDSLVDTYKQKGYRILSVPVEFYSDFKMDIERSLRDFAGISSSELTTYISGQRLAEAKTYEWKNPFVKDIIEVSDDPKDTSQYYDYIDESLINPRYKSKPLFVHFDMSLSNGTGDKSCIGGVWITGLDPHTHELKFHEAFVVSVKSPKGHQVSMEKNKQFIRDLKKHGWNVRGASSDTFQNAALAQDLKAAGFNYQVISVDRVTSDKEGNRVCEPYLFLKNAIYNKRLTLYDTELLTEERLGLELNNTNGKVDHSPNGINSKDSADAITGALYFASQHTEEYAFEYGEDLVESIKTVNHRESKEDYAKAFEEELKQTFGAPQRPFKDFGMGSAQEAKFKKQMDIQNGILMW